MRKETIYKITSVLLLSLPLVVFAQGIGIDYPKATAQGIAKGLGTVLGVAATMIGVALLILGIFKLATSGGDPREMDESKTSIIWAAIAIVVGVAMMNIMTVLGWFGVTF